EAFGRRSEKRAKVELRDCIKNPSAFDFCPFGGSPRGRLLAGITGRSAPVRQTRRLPWPVYVSAHSGACLGPSADNSRNDRPAKREPRDDSSATTTTICPTWRARFSSRWRRPSP